MRRGRRSIGKSSDLEYQAANITPIDRTEGGRFKPLTDKQCEDIHHASVEILSQIGLSEAPEIVVETIKKAGGDFRNGRLFFSQDLMDRGLKGMKRNITLHGQIAQHDMHLNSHNIYVGSGGAAPYIINDNNGEYMPSTLLDLYHAARLVDQLKHIAFFSRSLVATDIENDFLMDINTAYTCLSATKKHVMVSASKAEHVHAIADLCYSIAGSKQAFIERPFLSLNVNHVVPPLRLAEDACHVIVAALECGIPIMMNCFGQLGASSPVTLAGSVAQTMAETLAGMIFAWAINPDSSLICGPRAMITDLRTGGMSGGSGEQALCNAMTIQMAQYYQLPNSTIAGASDSKSPDIQAGYEKALNISLAAHAGANLITQACGMHAGLMAVSLASYVIDNDMIGSILRSTNPIVVDQDTLAIQAIAEVVGGDGHFLGRDETYQRMKSDFLYPEIADRQSFEQWQLAGAPKIREKAKQKVAEILSSDYSNHISAECDQAIRAKFNILLNSNDMRKI